MKFESFLNIMDILLGENGCPWDKEQTHESLRQYLLEECYEVLEAIDNNDMIALQEELGDMLLQVVFHAKLAEKTDVFTVDDVIAGVSHKLTSRHTHVFGSDKALSAEDVVQVWEANKQKEQQLSPVQAMVAVPKALPALMRASKVLKRAPHDNPSADTLYNSLHTSLDNLAMAKAGHEEILGGMLLELVNLANALKVNPELALISAVEGVIQG